jgi:23S rRNA pseudouridine1911/1915/1917 synthase
VHRLDRDTSGLMVFARTPAAQGALETQFKARDVGRSYLAIVHGHPKAMTITTHIVRDRGDGLRGSAEVWGKDPATGQRSVTHIEPLEAIGDYSVVRCRLETGRTHQIRIHLSEIGHMLCGEKEYVRRPDGTRRRDESGAPRQVLHAEELVFLHPATGREMRFASRPPKDLADWLETVRTGVRTSRPQSRDR